MMTYAAIAVYGVTEHETRVVTFIKSPSNLSVGTTRTDTVCHIGIGLFKRRSSWFVRTAIPG